MKNLLDRQLRYGNVLISFRKRGYYDKKVSVAVVINDLNNKIICRHAIPVFIDNKDPDYDGIIHDKCLWCLIHISRFVNCEKAKIKRWAYFKQWLKLKM